MSYENPLNTDFVEGLFTTFIVFAISWVIVSAVALLVMLLVISFLTRKDPPPSGSKDFGEPFEKDTWK